MSHVNKLQLVDANKLSEILDLLKKDYERKTMLRGMTDKNEFQLDEAQQLMETKNAGNPRQGEKIIDFLKKKARVKREHEADDSPVETQPVPQQVKQKPTDISEQNLKRFITKNGMIQPNKNMITNSNVNIDDFLYDFTHNASKQFHLQPLQQKQVMKELKKKNMPAGHIRNNFLRNKYIAANFDTTSSITASYPSAHPSWGSRPGTSSQAFYAKRLKKLKTRYNTKL